MRTYLGTWQVTPSDGFWTDQDPSSGESLLSTAVRLGVTCFDTAQSYGKGRTEQVLGKILRRFPDRKFVVRPWALRRGRRLRPWGPRPSLRPWALPR
ncbi:MAG: aldo/keto reductase, partial [Spirochaetales bacterium]|nr:aldo/keto reductase [Spirochaetales bacterium]